MTNYWVIKIPKDFIVQTWTGFIWPVTKFISYGMLTVLFWCLGGYITNCEYTTIIRGIVFFEWLLIFISLIAYAVYWCNKK